MARKSIRRALAAAASMVALVGITTSPALADSAQWDTLGTGQNFVAVSDDIVGVCAGDSQVRKGAPLTPDSGTLTSHKAGADVPRNWQTSQGNKDITSVVSADKSWIVAALYHLYAGSVSDSKLQAESFSWAVQSQLDAFGRFYMPALSDGGKLADRMLAEAEKIAGPYKFDVWASYESGKLQIQNIGVRGRSGWIPGLDVELRVIHPDAGEFLHTLKTKSEPIQFDLDADRPGEVQVEVKVLGLPSATIQIWEHPKYQDLVVVPLEGEPLFARGTTDIPIEKLQLQIETKVKNPVITDDEMPIDMVTVSAPSWPVDEAGNPVSVVVRAQLYGPMQQAPQLSDAPPEGMEPYATTYLTAAAEGTYETPQLQLEDPLEAGYYTWVVSALEQDQELNPHADSTAATLQSDFVSQFGIASETFQVVQTSSIEEPTEDAEQATTEPTEEPTPAPTDEPTEAPSQIENNIRQAGMLANTGAEDLIIPAIALALMGVGFLMFRIESRRQNQDA
ncbi:MAG: hypothetical protein Q4D87_02935 [Actinomycetaceae bacterium]|nr:hypothetical protein [Actinomycetaceae bacterium]